MTMMMKMMMMLMMMIIIITMTIIINNDNFRKIYVLTQQWCLTSIQRRTTFLHVTCGFESMVANTTCFDHNLCTKEPKPLD